MKIKSNIKAGAYGGFSTWHSSGWKKGTVSRYYSAGYWGSVTTWYKCPWNGNSKKWCY